MVRAEWRMRGMTFGVCGALLALVALACALPIEDGVSVVAGVFFFGLGLLLLGLVPDAHERTILQRLFVVAFLLRLVCMLLAYALGVVDLLGSSDDVGWRYSWEITRFWREYAPAPPNIRNVPGLRPPVSFIEVLGKEYGQNRGWFFYTAYFFYLIETPSQIALTFINNFLSSLTPCVIYVVARKYFSERGSLVAAGAAVIFPGFVIWSALTLKEPWLIFLEIVVFYLWWEALSARRYWLISVAILLTLVTYSMRFYVGYVMFAAVPFIVIGATSKTPVRSATLSVLAIALGYVLGTMLGVIHTDVVAIVAGSMEDLSTFRGATSGANGGTNGTATGVVLPYDPSTPFGAFMLVLIGMAYLLLSPFPWALSGKQVFALPDVAIWWYLVFMYIIPGIKHAWKKYPGPSVAILSYLAPLVLVYSFSFGNIGLAYRQRAQLMPFFLFFAAAGYDARRKKKQAESGLRKPSVDDIVERLRQSARTAPQLQAAKAPEPAVRAEVR